VRVAFLVVRGGDRVKVRVAYTTTVDDAYRRAIRRHYGQPGLATRAEVQAWLRTYGSSEDENLMWDAQEDEAA
jgi:hypothetical protein